jgi:hypothetical protein
MRGLRNKPRIRRIGREHLARPSRLHNSRTRPARRPNDCMRRAHGSPRLVARCSVVARPMHPRRPGCRRRPSKRSHRFPRYRRYPRCRRSRPRHRIRLRRRFHRIRLRRRFHRIRLRRQCHLSHRRRQHPRFHQFRPSRLQAVAVAGCPSMRPRRSPLATPHKDGMRSSTQRLSIFVSRVEDGLLSRAR